jgi:hypothetical protein
MAAQGGASTPAPQKVTRRGWGCLAALVVVVISVIAAASGGSKSSSSSGGSSGAQQEAREYISQKSKIINIGRIDYEHVALLVGLAGSSENGSGTIVNELAKVAQEAHNEIDGFRNALVKTEGNEKLDLATATLSEGANELKNAMGRWSPIPATQTLRHWHRCPLS